MPFERSDYVYRGRRTPNGCEVVVRYNVSGSPIEQPLPLRLEVRRHSPSGFEWGYGGSGPAQLALALLCHALGRERGSDPGLYQRFKFRVVGHLPPDVWELSEQQLREHVAAIEAGQ